MGTRTFPREHRMARSLSTPLSEAITSFERSRWDLKPSTKRGYLPNTSLTLAAGKSQTYEFKFFKVASEDEVKSRLYTEGLIDVTAVPSMMFATRTLRPVLTRMPTVLTPSANL